MSVRHAVVAAAVAALAAPAAAYVRSTSETTGAPLFWPTPAVPYHVSSHASFQSPSCTATAAGDPAIDAITASFAAWEQSCSPLQLVYSGRIDEFRTGEHGGTFENLVVLRQGFCSVTHPNDPCMRDPDVDCGNLYDCFEDTGRLNRSVVALTSVLYQASTGRIVNADIEVNGWDGQAAGTALPTGAPAHGWYFTCLAPGDGVGRCANYGDESCFFMDLQNTVTHEVGHFIGLAHVCEFELGTCRPGDAAQTALTMYPGTAPGDVDKRTLAQDDIDGVCTIYPQSSGGGGGCASAGQAAAATALLLAIAALRRGRRRVRSS